VHRSDWIAPRAAALHNEIVADGCSVSGDCHPLSAPRWVFTEGKGHSDTAPANRE